LSRSSVNLIVTGSQTTNCVMSHTIWLLEMGTLTTMTISKLNCAKDLLYKTEIFLAIMLEFKPKNFVSLSDYLKSEIIVFLKSGCMAEEIAEMNKKGAQMMKTLEEKDNRIKELAVDCEIFLKEQDEEHRPNMAERQKLAAVEFELAQSKKEVSRKKAEIANLPITLDCLTLRRSNGEQTDELLAQHQHGELLPQQKRRKKRNLVGCPPRFNIPPQWNEGGGRGNM
jgi:hypothetical protein